MNAPKKVLLVEDNRYDRYFFVLALSQIENVLLFDIARNGKEALAKLEKSATLPDIIFTDIHMPVLDGIQCLADIVKNPHTRNIPVVVLSSAVEEINRVREIGARAFIRKAGDCKILRQQLEQMINLDFNAHSHIANQTFQTALSA